jgi:hypothetical protein
VSPETDRIAVPTNGKHPHPLPQPAQPVSPASAARPTLPPTAPFTPTQLAVGFGILAALVALIAGSLRRRGRSGRRRPFGRR